MYRVTIDILPKSLPCFYVETAGDLDASTPWNSYKNEMLNTCKMFKTVLSR